MPWNYACYDLMFIIEKQYIPLTVLFQMNQTLEHFSNHPPLNQETVKK
jgi:hypothetical protein